MGKTVIVVVAAALASVAAVVALGPLPTAAEEQPAYVGTQVCSGCHKSLYEEWLLTPHRRTLAEGRPTDLSGCEACHGPGGAHVAAGGDATKIVRLKTLDPQASNEVCLKCHKQQDVVLFRTSTHAMAKLRCTNCHAVHEPGHATMLQQIESQQLSIKGLTKEIEQAKQRVNIERTAEARSAAQAEVDRLEAKKAELKKSLDAMESRTRRASEPELCYTCHTRQQAQFKLPSHHPVPESKMQCTGCHNPHGGASIKWNLREESVNQTCFRCHPEMAGPYVFEHPPVEEDCTICHRPHGSPQNFLLKQSEPFLCLKCHAGPHSRGGTLQNPSDAPTTSRVPYYYWQCTSCHTRPHGSDRHAAFHY